MNITKQTNKIAVAEKSQQAWQMFEHMLSRQYLSSIADMPVMINQTGLSDMLKTVRIDKITRILYDKSEDNLTKFNNLFTAMHSSGSAVFVLLRNNGDATEIYLGVKAESPAIADEAINTLEKSLNGNFPGISHEKQMGAAPGILSDSLRNGKFVACVSGVPSNKSNTSEMFSQGLEKIIDAMGNTPYTALFLAKPVMREKLCNIERAYQDMYSALSLLNISQFSLSEQESIAFGKNIGETLSSAISTSISQASTYSKSKNTAITKTDTAAYGTADSLSQANTDTTSKSSTDTRSQAESLSYAHSHSKSESKTVTETTGLNFSAVVAGASRSTSHGKTTGTTDTDTFTKGTTDTQSHADTVGTSQAKTKTTGQTTSVTKSSADGKSFGEGITETSGATDTTGKTDTKASMTGTNETVSSANTSTYNYNVSDKHITESLNLIDEQLLRIRSARNYGAWEWAGYFIADTPADARNGANIYSGILAGEKTGLERTAVITWSDKDCPRTKAVRNNLARFEHPAFSGGEYEFNATSLITTQEVTVGMSLPQKSLPNIPVFESTHFGRTVATFKEKENCRTCEIGSISHLNTKTNQPVSLDLDSLCSHTFITGSTGSGKSKAVNNLLAKAVKQNVKFLVIEPAKGEYKDIWGGLKNCNVFGTNPSYTTLLKLNPFSFPKEIHVMEHIDRLIEILNAVWPMYAAMPAILKDAIEKTYESCGWNLLTSKNTFSPVVYPDFVDVMNILPAVIEKSEYSAETKGNYTGALVTRIHSMTNGYYRFIFQKEEICPETLFEKNTIVDLSRVGSSETKSLLMGVLFLKLQEYRIAQKNIPDQKLQHITVLEEAHHLLRRTSMEQGQETANLQGKAVEMLTNAIAEMRTYGEGFIIADQAPGLLDQAVIRNTNTKIVFRLPDYNDRQLVGKSQHLNEEQITELSRLPTGCAAVYQNDWQEAVLCQFELFDPNSLYSIKGVKKYIPPSDPATEDARTKSEKILLRLLLKKMFTGNKFAINSEDQWSLSIYYPHILNNLNMYPNAQILELLNEMFIKPALEATPHLSNVQMWLQKLHHNLKLDHRISCLNNEEMKNLRCVVYKILSKYSKNPEQKQYWLQLMTKESGDAYNV